MTWWRYLAGPLVTVALLGLTAPNAGAGVAGCPVLPADNIWNVRIDGLPVHPRSDDYIDTTVERLRATTADQIRRAVNTYTEPDDVTVAVVCTAKNLMPELEAWGRAKSIDVIDWKTTITD